MERKVTFVQYGCGKMGKYLMRYGLEKGAELLGAFDMNPALIGKDVSTVIEHGYSDLGIKIMAASEADAFFADNKVDVCIIATRSTIAELEDIFTICAKHGVNAITTCEEALYPWNSNPELTVKLDKLAKELAKKMRQAAAELNFEEAARLRDRMKEVKQMLLDIEN